MLMLSSQKKNGLSGLERAQMDWRPSGKRQVWRTFNRRCQLLPMVDSLVSRKSSHGGSPARILFIGESIDRIIKDDVCNWAAALGSPAHEIGFDTDQVTLRVEDLCSQAVWLFTNSAQSTSSLRGANWLRQGWAHLIILACADSCCGAQVPVVHGKAQNFSCDHCSGCMTNFATLGFMYVFGVAPVGPYHMGKQRGWPERVPEVRLAHAPPTLTLLAPRLGCMQIACWQRWGQHKSMQEAAAKSVPCWWVMPVQLGLGGRGVQEDFGQCGPQVIKSFKDLNEGEGPDLLVFAANFWDIAGFALNNASKLAPDDLEEYVLEEFQGNLSAVLSAIDVRLMHPHSVFSSRV